MIKLLLKQPLFLIGVTFIILLLASSIIHAVVFDGFVPRHFLYYNENGTIIGSAPLTPGDYPPFGTDILGYDWFAMVIKGAKYTLGLAFVVAALRLLFSVFLGLYYGNYLMKVQRYVSGVVNSFHYLPIALLAYILLHDVLKAVPDGPYRYAFDFSLSERTLFEIIILTLVALPTTSLLIGNETHLIMKNEFITGARLIGGSRFHILKKHVMPHLAPRLWIQFAEQVIQVLILLVHLGLFGLFFGGTLPQQLPNKEIILHSTTGEWSGLIGSSYEFLNYTPWVPLVPLVAFACTILAMNFILEGLKKALAERDQPMTKVKTSKQKAEKPVQAPANPSFELVHSQQQMKG